MAVNRPSASWSWWRRPSWWIVVVAGSLFIFFLAAIIRELINGYNVRNQVARLRRQVAAEEQRQQQLQDLLEYLASPTFQERQARLSLGLKKTGERVVVIPPAAGQVPGGPTDSIEVLSGPAAWWAYFFSRQPVISST